MNLQSHRAAETFPARDMLNYLDNLFDHSNHRANYTIEHTCVSTSDKKRDCSLIGDMTWDKMGHLTVELPDAFKSTLAQGRAP